MAPPFTPLFINGQWRSASTNETFDVLNPFSRDVVGTSASATGKDCKDAIDAASSAFLTWERTSLSERSAIFLKAADLFATDRYKEKVFGAADETAATDYWSGFQSMVNKISNSVRHLADWYGSGGGASHSWGCRGHETTQARDSSNHLSRWGSHR